MKTTGARSAMNVQPINNYIPLFCDKLQSSIKITTLYTETETAIIIFVILIFWRNSRNVYIHSDAHAIIPMFGQFVQPFNFTECFNIHMSSILKCIKKTFTRLHWPVVDNTVLGESTTQSQLILIT